MRTSEGAGPGRPGLAGHPEQVEPVTRLSQTGRVEAFSDGVMAIAITLLVLDLKVPTAAEVSDRGSLLAALASHWPSYLAYLAEIGRASCRERVWGWGGVARGE